MLRITVITKLKPDGYHEQVKPGATVKDAFDQVVGGNTSGCTPKVNDKEVAWSYGLREGDVVEFDV